MFDNFLIQIKTNWVAIYGAIIASLGLSLSLFNYFRDKARIKIDFKQGWKFIGAVAPYKNNILYNDIKVINTGRRPINISSAGARVLKNKNGDHVLISDSFAQFKNKILTEENPSVDFYYESSILRSDDIYYLVVYDAAGRKYIKWIHPYKFFFDWIMRKT